MLKVNWPTNLSKIVRQILNTILTLSICYLIVGAKNRCACAAWWMLAHTGWQSHQVHRANRLPLILTGLYGNEMAASING